MLCSALLCAVARDEDFSTVIRCIDEEHFMHHRLRAAGAAVLGPVSWWLSERGGGRHSREGTGWAVVWGWFWGWIHWRILAFFLCANGIRAFDLASYAVCDALAGRF